MSEEADVEAGLVVIEDEQKNEEKGELTKNEHLEEQSAVTMTEEELARESTPDGEIEKVVSGLSEPGSSPLGSFQSLNSSQSSE